jgi:hypothetical protein
MTLAFVVPSPDSISGSPARRGGDDPVDILLPNDRGSLFANVADDEMASLGIALDTPNSAGWPRMSPASVKVSHGLVTLIRPSGEHQWPWFPYTAFVDYEAQEIAAGRPPLRLTATYAGKSRPVYWYWSLGFPEPGEPPKVTDRSAWEQGVNIGDDRYVRWLVDNYIEPVIFRQYYAADGRRADVDGPYPNQWLGMDEVAINYQLYGVLDDRGHWVPMTAGPVMDPPFPTGSAELHEMYQRFFEGLHEVRPGIRIMANVGSPDDWTMFHRDLADVDGLAIEDISASALQSGHGMVRLPTLLWWTAIGRYTQGGGVALLRSLLDPDSPTYESDLRTALMTYLILSGQNSAWAPQAVATNDVIPPSHYEAMKGALGPPTSAMERRDERADATALYVRRMENGVVYVNDSGRSVTVFCPAGVTCRGRSGQVVGELSIPDRTGDYLLTPSGG